MYYETKNHIFLYFVKSYDSLIEELFYSARYR